MCKGNTKFTITCFVDVWEHDATISIIITPGSKKALYTSCAYQRYRII